MTSATILCDSVAPSGARLTTMRLTMPRFILAEFNTHRVFSRNAGSSRAIRVRRRLAAIAADPVLPVSWGCERPGMSADEVLPDDVQAIAEQVWRAAAQSASAAAAQLADLGVHKQVVNRLLEPFSWVDVVVTSVEWQNFFRLRLSESAQPEMHQLATQMWAALQQSVPALVPWGYWHMPTITHADRALVSSVDDLLQVAAGRLARVSYEATGQSWEADRDLAQRLVTDGHWSPFEHCAKAHQGLSQDCRNFVRDWVQVRAMRE